jgi:hypothetical protein
MIQRRSLDRGQTAGLESLERLPRGSQPFTRTFCQVLCGRGMGGAIGQARRIDALHCR